jgi:hypothetical protein
MSYRLLTMPAQNPKTAKGMALNVLTFPLHLAPADLSGFEVCAMRTAGCTTGCLNTAGRGRFNATQVGRIRKTKLFFADRDAFMRALVKDVARAVAYAEKRGFQAAIRLNATSDIAWHRIAIDGYANIMARFPTAQFYDYTKVQKRITREALPANYHLTFSLADGNAAAAREVLAAGGNVAAVYRDKATVARAMAQGLFGFPVINGDETDLRFLDPRGSVVALYAKGKAKADQSGFVIDIA